MDTVCLAICISCPKTTKHYVVVVIVVVVDVAVVVVAAAAAAAAAALVYQKKVLAFCAPTHCVLRGPKSVSSEEGSPFNISTHAARKNVTAASCARRTSLLFLDNNSWSRYCLNIQYFTTGKSQINWFGNVKIVNNNKKNTEKALRIAIIILLTLKKTIVYKKTLYL